MANIGLITDVVITVTCGAQIIWAIAAAAFGNKGERISDKITAAAKQHPMVGFAIGLLVGHWLW